ncbi:MAG: sulfatase-like hydrolase/transferase [Planctomycetaceae bacterium]|nr:sulfatase-like hydrolase/transferase [Planctomycetaceae bacterium]
MRFLCLFAVTCCSLLATVNGAERPNVLLIYTDDQGSIDANCYGATDLATPTLDHLAETGVRFTQMYAPSAICSASRAGLMTGRFPVRAGVPGNVSSAHGHAGMPPEQITIAEAFHDAGYHTGHIGKWHLGYDDVTMPNAQGYDYSFGHMGGCIDNYSHFFYWDGPNRHDLWRNGKEIWMDGQFFPDLMVKECKQFLTQNKAEPFFLYWAINVPHYPMQGTEKWRQHYKDMPAPRRMYAEFVSTADERIGQVLAHLTELGLREKTIVVVQSDHGHSTEERAFFGGGNAGPYRGAKGCLFEGGLRVPSFVSWPGKVPQGEVREQLAVGCDWFPTLLDFCELPAPKHTIEGRSLRSVIIENGESPHESWFWQLGTGNNAQYAVRQGNWKLLVNPRDNSQKQALTADDKSYLVNLQDDIGEMKNLQSEAPEQLKVMQTLLEKYQSEN